MRSHFVQQLCACALSTTLASHCLSFDSAQFKQTGSNQFDRPLVTCPDRSKLQTWFKPVTQLNADISQDAEQLPLDCSVGLFQSAYGRANLASHVRWEAMPKFHWRATNFSHQPLYFDDQILERYGQTFCPCLQPIISGGKFFAALTSMPYRMWINRTHDCMTTLGYHRPGSAMPCYRDAVHWR